MELFKIDVNQSNPASELPTDFCAHPAARPLPQTLRVRPARHRWPFKAAEGRATLAPLPASPRSSSQIGYAAGYVSSPAKTKHKFFVLFFGGPTRCAPLDQITDSLEHIVGPSIRRNTRKIAAAASDGWKKTPQPALHADLPPGIELTLKHQKLRSGRFDRFDPVYSESGLEPCNQIHRQAMVYTDWPRLGTAKSMLQMVAPAPISKKSFRLVSTLP